MIKKLLHIVCVLFVFTSSIAVADTYKKEDVIKINDIQMVEHVAYKIVKHAVKNKIEIFDKNGKTIDAKSIIGTEMYIKQSDLMDAVSYLYHEAISDNKDTETIVDYNTPQFLDH